MKKLFFNSKWILAFAGMTMIIAGCSGAFSRLEQSESGNSPKKQLIATVVPAQSIVGEFNAPTERSSPLIVGDVIYQGSVHNRFLALQKKSGRLIWERTIPNGVESSAAYFDDKVYFGSNDGNFYCLNATNGKIIWKYNSKVEILSTPVVRGGIVYFSTVNNALYALKSATGEWVWYFNKGYIQKLSIRGGSSPAYQDGKIYIGFSDGYIYCFNAFDGKALWFKKLSEAEKFVDIDMTPIVSNRDIIVGSFDGFLYSLNPINGNVQWKYNDSQINGVAANENFIFVTTSSKSVFCLNRKKGTKVWNQTLKNVTPTNPILVEDQVIFVTTDNYVYSLTQDKGQEIWRYNTDTGVSSQPAFDKDKLYIFTDFSKLHIIDPFYLIPGA